MVAFLGKQLDPRKQSVCLQAEKGAVIRVGQKKMSKMHYLRRQQGGKAPAAREDKRMLLFGVWG